MSGESSGEARGNKIRSHIAWWLGVSSAIVGILAFFLTQCAHKGPTFEGWKTKASAACEKEMPAIEDANFKSITALNSLDPNAEVDSVERDSTAAALRQLSIAVQHLVGTWREIDRPDDRRDDIESLFTTGTAVSDAYAATAEAIRKDTLQSDNYDDETKALGDFLNQMDAMGLKQCHQLANHGFGN